MSDDPWTDGFNMAVLGKTQTGKTSVCRELHGTSPRLSIWLNEHGDHRVPDVDGVVVQSLDELKRAFAEDHYKIEWVARDRRRAVVELKEFLWTVADRVDRSLDMQVVADEVDRLAPQSNEKYGNNPPRDAVRDFTSEGVKRGVKWVGITQDPVSYDKQALRQSEYRLIFPMAAEHKRSSVVRKMSLDWNAVESGDRYSGTLHKDTGEVLDERVRAAREYVS